MRLLEFCYRYARRQIKGLRDIAYAGSSAQRREANGSLIVFQDQLRKAGVEEFEQSVSYPRIAEVTQPQSPGFRSVRYR